MKLLPDCCRNGAVRLHLAINAAQNIWKAGMGHSFAAVMGMQPCYAVTSFVAHTIIRGRSKGLHTSVRVMQQHQPLKGLAVHSRSVPLAREFQQAMHARPDGIGNRGQHHRPCSGLHMRMCTSSTQQPGYLLGLRQHTLGLPVVPEV